MSKPLLSSETTIRVLWVGTAAFVVTAVAAAALPPDPLRPVAVAVAGAAFVAGSAFYLAGYARAVQRSRRDEISMAALTFLAGDTAPASVRRQLLGATALQVVVAVATAAARPFSTLAFGILAPVLGIGVQTFWASRFGTFPRREVAPPRTRRPSSPPTPPDASAPTP